MTFTNAETEACKALAALAFHEDVAPATAGESDPARQTIRDATSAIIPRDLQGRAVFVARTAGVLCGLPAVAVVADEFGTEHSPQLTIEPLRADGDRIAAGDPLAIVAGNMAAILVVERTALNFLQRLSGVASLTRRYVDAIAGLPCQVLDTRKTTPGWRLLEKYAVRCGGGHNHRLGLFDGILIKDNHLAALGGGLTAVTRAIDLARQAMKTRIPLEIEVDTLDQLQAALAGRPDIVLLDNMSLEQLREAVRRRDVVAPGVLLEASGGVTLDTVRAIAETGVDRISVGALTHSAPALDIALDYQ